jgi:septum formation protein
MKKARSAVVAYSLAAFCRPRHTAAFIATSSTDFLSSTRVSLKMGKSNPLDENNLPAPLLLGSGSFTRKLILSEMNIPFHKIVREIDERGLGDRSKDKPSDLVLLLAKAKMDHLINEIQAGNCHNDLPSGFTSSDEWVVLTGDQVVTHAGNILEKPDSVEQAKEFVTGYASSPCSTVGSCVLTHLPSGIQVSGVDTATIHFKPTITGDIIDNLLKEDAPVLSCAGGLMIEHPLTREHIDRIDGTEDSVMGLSKDLVTRLLGELRQKLTAK